MNDARGNTISRPVSRDRGIFQGQVRERRTVCREHFEITLQFDRFPNCEPGQFVQVLCREPNDSLTGHSHDSQYEPNAFLAARLESFGSTPLLRRPFSIASHRRVGGSIELSLMGRVVGPGTAWLDRLTAGESLNILGPLGRPFTMPSVGRTALLVAGGIGLPPIRWLGEYLSGRKIAATAIVGAQSRDLLPVQLVKMPETIAVPAMCVEEFARFGVPSIVTTDDGSSGMRGRVTDAMSPILANGETLKRLQVYACGPEPMLRAIAELCNAHQVPCELAMERVMACGMGTCQSCVVPVRDSSASQGWRYALCCTEGPVVNAERIIWSKGNH